jgi:toxin ParE1/3/4
LKVEFSDAAEHDLESIADYIARDNPGRARTFVQELEDKCLGLADMSLRFPLVPGFEAVGIRKRTYGNYLIFYRVDETSIYIIHILNGAMDYDGMLM